MTPGLKVNIIFEQFGAKSAGFPARQAKIVDKKAPG
jgi:hypothetical protein